MNVGFVGRDATVARTGPAMGFIVLLLLLLVLVFMVATGFWFCG